MPDIDHENDIDLLSYISSLTYDTAKGAAAFPQGVILSQASHPHPLGPSNL